MAEIAFGMAVPHSGMLGQKPEDWLSNGERERKNPELWFQGKDQKEIWPDISPSIAIYTRRRCTTVRRMMEQAYKAVASCRYTDHD